MPVAAKGKTMKKIFGLCPDCQELAWHNREASTGLYKCVKCDMWNEIDMIPRVVEWDQTQPAA